MRQQLGALGRGPVEKQEKIMLRGGQEQSGERPRWHVQRSCGRKRLVCPESQNKTRVVDSCDQRGVTQLRALKRQEGQITFEFYPRSPGKSSESFR